MQEQNRDQDFYEALFSAPRRGFEGLVKGFMCASAFCGALDFAGIISFKPESKNFYLGLFGQRALASRPPQTLYQGLFKGAMFSTVLTLFASNHLETSTILKLIVGATALCGAWGARNELRFR